MTRDLLYQRPYAYTNQLGHPCSLKLTNQLGAMFYESKINCNEYVFPEVPNSQTKEPKSKSFNICKLVFVIMATILCLLFLIIGGVLVASERNKQFGLLIGRTLADWHYPIVRFVRLSTLPLHTWFNISHMYSWECIINNPSHQQG